MLVEGLACRAGAGTTPWGDYECVYRTHLEKSGVRAGESPKVQIHLGGLYMSRESETSQNAFTESEKLLRSGSLWGVSRIWGFLQGGDLGASQGF